MNKKPEGCKECALFKLGAGFCTHSTLVDNPRLLIQGEAPGKNEVIEGVPFVGKSGNWLRRLLESCGLNEGEVVFDNTIRCLYTKGKAKYPTGKVRQQAEQTCRQYDIWERYVGCPILLVGGKALRTWLDDDKISKWHGHIEVIRGRLVGCTYHPAAVLRNPNLIPLFVQETRNLLNAARNPALIKHPRVNKGYLLHAK